MWGGLHGIKPYGVLGAALAMVVAPALGISAAVVGRRVVGRVLKRASRQMRHPLHATLWITSGLVGFADGTNDGQKAMAVITAVLVARGSATPGDIPFWVRLTVGVTLAVGTLLGARVLRTVSRRLYPSRPLDAVTAETTSAVVILAVVGRRRPGEHDRCGHLGGRRHGVGGPPASRALGDGPAHRDRVGRFAAREHGRGRAVFAILDAVR